MEKKFIAMLVCVALMGCIFVSAQDICKTVANVPMVQLNNGVKPAVLQIECHSYAQRLAIRDKVKPYGIHITCWFLLGGAMSNGALFSLSSDK